MAQTAQTWIHALPVQAVIGIAHRRAVAIGHAAQQPFAGADIAVACQCDIAHLGTEPVAEGVIGKAIVQIAQRDAGELPFGVIAVVQRRRQRRMAHRFQQPGGVAQTSRILRQPCYLQ